jgi:putative membrane protein
MTSFRASIAAAAALAPTAALADPAGGYGDGAWAGHMWGGGYGMFFGPFFMLLWLGVIVFVLVLAFRWLEGRGSGSGKTEDTALATLRARYARGEIDHEEFEERLRRLQG